MLNLYLIETNDLIKFNHVGKLDGGAYESLGWIYPQGIDGLTLPPSDGERDSSPSVQETPAVRVQPDRRAKTKEPGFRYTA
ncbi:unnamed protein product [Spirodela intermedia]|uniref:Uncharacterized protein n=1 Tax=Spirodela intermedia TaxID=51605 RepID=A0ABN7EB79_SPIIN|nr:unnamed protein product [Spirodela intermedia]